MRSVAPVQDLVARVDLAAYVLDSCLVRSRQLADDDLCRAVEDALAAVEAIRTAALRGD